MEIELFPKQEQFFKLSNRINVFSGGIQSSKTTTGAIRFVHHGILQHRHKDDNFLVAADTYKTLHQATIPTFKKYAHGLGKMNEAKAEFKTVWGSTVYFRTATDPESPEGIPNVKRVWLDEGGKVSLYFFENLMGRAARLEAPVDITSTPYSQNWLAKIWKDTLAGKRDDVSLVHCKSVESPYFSRNEYERQKRLLDPRRFAMKYDGEFGQMVGLVFDRLLTCKAFPMPPGTKYYAGVDFGYHPDPFALVIRAVTPDKKHYRVAEFYKNYLIAEDIVRVVQQYHGMYRFQRVVCDPSRPDSIAALARAGIPAVGGKNDIKAGIDVHYSLMKQERFFVFEDENPIGIDEYNSYHYPEEKELGFDESRREKETLPVDANNHGCDADRYLSMELETVTGERLTPRSPHSPEAPRDLAKRLEWLKRGGSSRYSA